MSKSPFEQTRDTVLEITKDILNGTGSLDHLEAVSLHHLVEFGRSQV